MTTSANNTQANNTNPTADAVKMAAAMSAAPQQERGFVGRAWDSIPTSVKYVAGAAAVAGIGYVAYKHFKGDSSADGVVDTVGTIASTAAGLAVAAGETAGAAAAAATAAGIDALMA